MRRLRNLLWVLFLSFFVATPAVAANTQQGMQQGIQQANKHLVGKRLNEGLDKILQQTLKDKLTGANVGIVVQSMCSGKTLYQKNADHLFAPASVLKLLTAAAALDYLKPAFVFHTQLLSKGKVLNHVLQGDLTVKFSGDPTLTTDDLNALFAQLYQKGIHKIAGPIFIDNFDYGRIPYPPGWIWDDLSYSFSAPLNAIVINENYFILHFVPGKNGGKPSLKSNLPGGVATFSNSLRTIKKFKKHCPISIYSDVNNHYKITGCFYQKWKRQMRKLAIRNVIPYAKKIIQQALKENKIAYVGDGKIRVRQVPKGAKILVQHNSPALSKIVKTLLKKSDNLMANAVLKRIGETYYGKTGTWENSLQALRLLLGKPARIDFSKNLINDGSGLSRYNLLSPMQLSKLQIL